MLMLSGLDFRLPIEQQVPLTYSVCVREFVKLILEDLTYVEYICIYVICLKAAQLQHCLGALPAARVVGEIYACVPKWSKVFGLLIPAVT